MSKIDFQICMKKFYAIKIQLKLVLFLVSFSWRYRVTIIVCFTFLDKNTTYNFIWTLCPYKIRFYMWAMT